MKRITLLALISIGLITKAQTTFNASDFAQTGDSFTISESSTGLQGFDFEATGTDFNWNFNTLPVSTQRITFWNDPNEAGYKAAWCTLNGFIFSCNTEFNNAFNLANQSFEELGIPGFELSNIVNHYNLKTDAVERKMLGASIDIGGTGVPLIIDYAEPDIEYQFPITFNDSYTNTGSYVIDLNALGVPLSYSESIQRINQVEGWGSLTIPFGTFNEVLKMKTTIIQNIELVTESETIPTTITTIVFKWFDPNYGIPVLEVSGQEVGGQFVPTAINYIDNQQCLSPTALFSFLPVIPEYDYDTNSSEVTFINLSVNYDQIEWDFGDGTIVSEDNPIHTFLCPGIQQVTLTVSNSICNPEETAMITLPITILDPNNEFTSTVTATETSLSADRTTPGTTYQWIDCSSNIPINGQINQEFTPTQDGIYAVELTTNGCVGMSNCINFEVGNLGITDFDIDSQIRLYPIPTKEVLYLSNPKNVEIYDIAVYDISGKQVSKSLDLSALQSGIYFVRLASNDESTVKKVIKD